MANLKITVVCLVALSPYYSCLMLWLKIARKEFPAATHVYQQTKFAG